MPDAATGSLAICDGNGNLKAPVPGACGKAAMCSISQVEAIVGKNPEIQNNCPDTMSDGSLCGNICPTTHISVGGFRCQYGFIVGNSGCAPQSMPSATATVVASTISATVAGPTSGMADAFSTAFGNVLGTQMLSVIVRNNAGEVVSNTSAVSSARLLSMTQEDAPTDGRRLQTIYKIDYEAVILPSSGVRPDTVAQRGVALTTSGSSEMGQLLSALSASGLTASGVSLIMAPRTFQTKVPVNANGIVESISSLPTPEADNFAIAGTGTTVTQGGGISGATIGIMVGGLLGCGCITAFCYFYQVARKRLTES